MAFEYRISDNKHPKISFKIEVREMAPIVGQRRTLKPDLFYLQIEILKTRAYILINAIDAAEVPRDWPEFCTFWNGLGEPGEAFQLKPEMLDERQRGNIQFSIGEVTGFYFRPVVFETPHDPGDDLPI